MNPQQKFQTSNNYKNTPLLQTLFGSWHHSVIVLNQNVILVLTDIKTVLSFKIDVKTPIKSISFVFYGVSSSCLSYSIFCFLCSISSTAVLMFSIKKFFLYSAVMDFCYHVH